MKTFAFDVAGDVDDAVALLAADPEAKLLGGGTNLVDLMKLGVERPTALIDVTRLPLREVDVRDDGTVRVGAGVPNSDLAVHPVIRARYSVLSRAVLSGASGQLRNMATTGGNLFQRTRCVYFMDSSKPCNKREPGSGCPAIEGEHRNLAILGASEDCIATHPSDMGVALAVLDATVEVLGPEGPKTVTFGDLHRLPGDDPTRDTTLQHHDMVTSIDLPPLPDGAVSVYRKVRDRESYAFAVVSVGAVLVMDGDTVKEVRLALGGVAHKPWRATTAERAITGGPATEDAFRIGIRAELAAAQPLRDNEFKVRLAENLVVNTLVDLVARARNQGVGA
ncbi:FAD-binding molybdopterin dehydrogenase [Rhodococcoides trifolii]|uniref:FAD-binding molybdopterin dehydrogenase n=1 Tax=Rhodococcoides trifolii TaxID=908250 RepID=A0A917G912_9NOCA|nr:xanthine dehydrogenase family protein subunit M [Rhodococcus trifolii]GGG29751.1 FAD-binding molybdopterin dehydrogenase [Rhodococcus trifolii]